MKIGELSKLTGISSRNLRFYADEGLFGKLPRTHKGYREFPPKALEVVSFIQQGQGCGFTLSEINALLHLHVDAPETCCRVADLLDQKLQEAEAQLERIQRLKANLTDLRAICREAAPMAPCPVLSPGL
jgi:DNA-binding transcriptional MerR regulator